MLANFPPWRREIPPQSGRLERELPELFPVEDCLRFNLDYVGAKGNQLARGKRGSAQTFQKEPSRFSVPRRIVIFASVRVQTQGASQPRILKTLAPAEDPAYLGLNLNGDSNAARGISVFAKAG